MPESKPVFECSIHEFTTEDIAKFREHLASELHTVSGSTKCSGCKDVCENDSTEEIVLQPGQAASARCPGCMKKEEERVIERLRKAGKLEEVLNLSKEDKKKK